MSFKLFVYGTLLPGESNYGLVKPFLRASKPGVIGGRLYDAGEYPGLVLSAYDMVSGLWYTVDNEAMVVLDELEGYRGPHYMNEYERVWISDAMDPSVQGWVYVWEEQPPFPLIQSGNWLMR
jgi:gamma-glutamylcyclotransferase (GGCT)/AIG2-like uncharacterized protein YtfP